MADISLSSLGLDDENKEMSSDPACLSQTLSEKRELEIKTLMSRYKNFSNLSRYDFKEKIVKDKEKPTKVIFNNLNDVFKSFDGLS